MRFYGLGWAESERSFAACAFDGHREGRREIPVRKSAAKEIFEPVDEEKPLRQHDLLRDRRDPVDVQRHKAHL